MCCCPNCDGECEEWDEDEPEFTPGWLTPAEDTSGPLLDHRGVELPPSRPFITGFHSAR